MDEPQILNRCPKCDSGNTSYTQTYSYRINYHTGKCVDYSFPVIKEHYTCEDCKFEWDEYGCPAPLGSRVTDGTTPSDPPEHIKLTRHQKFAKALRDNASEYGLIAEDVDRDIEIGGHTYTIIGVNIRKITTPIAICRKATREVSFKSVAFIHKILEISPDVFEQLDSNPEHIYAGNFREYAEEYGLTLEHLGQEITYKGKIYKIAGLRFTSKKAPIVVTYDEKRCFAPLALVQKALGVEVSEAPAKPKAAKKSATPKGAHQETEQEDIESPIETPSGPEYVPDPLLVPAPESPAREAALEPAPPPAPGHAPKVKADIPASELEHLLRNAGAREGTLLWAKGKSFTQFWTACQVGTWMLALAGSMAGQPGWPTHQQVSLAACVCAETALKYVPPGENSPKVLIDFVKRWSRGEISDVDVKEVGSKVAAAIAAEPPRGVKNALKAAQATTNLIGGTNGVSVAAAASYAAVAASAIVPESDAPAARAKVDAGCADLVRRELPLSTFSLI